AQLTPCVSIAGLASLSTSNFIQPPFKRFGRSHGFQLLVQRLRCLSNHKDTVNRVVAPRNYKTATLPTIVRVVAERSGPCLCKPARKAQPTSLHAAPMIANHQNLPARCASPAVQSAARLLSSTTHQ